MKLNGDKLRDARDAKGMKQADAAREIGISPATLSSAEQSEDIRSETGLLICRFYGFDITDTVIPRCKENVNA